MSRDSRRPCEYVLRRTRLGVCVATVVAACAASAQQPAQDDPPEAQPARGATSYMPVALERPFQEIYEEFSARKEEVMERARNLLEQRYDLSDRPVQGVTMTRGKPVQGGVRVRLPEGVSSWEELAAMPRSEIAARNLFPEGFKPLPHPFHEEGGMGFPQHHIDEILAQEQRDLNRFDVEFDIPEHFLPEFPPPIFLTTRPELGDVSQGQLVTTQNFFELFNGILNPKQLEGLRLLVSPFPQQQFNMTN